MLERIDGLPDHVFGVRASGEVTGEDLKKVLLPGLEELSSRFNEVYYLLVLNTEVGNFTSSAWLQDMLAGIKHFSEWKKMGIVTDQKGVRKFTDKFSAIAPGKARGFKHSQLEEAIAWVSAPEEQQESKGKFPIKKIALAILGIALLMQLFKNRHH